MDCTVKKRKASAREAATGGVAKADPASKMRMRIESAIRQVPRGKVSTYGAIARAAGLPGRARQVAQVLHRGFELPWQRLLGAGGEIKLRGDSAIEQRLRLEAEGVRFRGRRVDMKQSSISLGAAKHPVCPRRKCNRKSNDRIVIGYFLNCGSIST
jgi:methylated-DNA-protein-cysteine methyltransferase-like protein